MHGTPRQSRVPQNTAHPIASHRIPWIHIALLVALGAIVYCNSFAGAFLWDDETLICNNELIRSWANLPHIIAGNLFGTGTPFYRPLQAITFLLDYSLWQLDVAGYHLTNIILHIAVALCVRWLVMVLFGDALFALFTALLFIVHPIHTEAISYISGRADPLAALFILLSCIMYVKDRREPRAGTLAATLGFFALALLSRENGLILPLLLLVYHYAFRERIGARQFLPVLAVPAIHVIARMTILEYVPSHLAATTTLIERIPVAFAALAGYARLLVLPIRLHMEYGYIHFKVLDLQVIAGATLFMGAVVYAVARRNDRAGVFAILWFLVALLPHSNLFPINAYLAEHWLYLPSIGFFVLVARPLARAVRGRFRALAVGALALLVVAYSLLTVRQNGYWHDPLVFYARTLSYTPHSDRVAYNLGLAYLMRGQNEKAVVYFRRALALTPTHKEAHNNLGLALLNLGRVPEAIGSFEAAVKSDPSYADAYSNLGTAYMRTRHMEKALESLQNAIRYKPGLANAHANLGSLYHSLGRDAEACWSFERALERDPRNANMWNDLGIVYETMGDAAKASASYRKALAIDPAHRGAQENIRRLVR